MSGKVGRVVHGSHAEQRVLRLGRGRRQHTGPGQGLG